MKELHLDRTDAVAVDRASVQVVDQDFRNSPRVPVLVMKVVVAVQGGKLHRFNYQVTVELTGAIAEIGLLPVQQVDVNATASVGRELLPPEH